MATSASTANAFTVFCTVIAYCGTIFGFVLIARMIHIRIQTKTKSIMYWTAFICIAFYTAVMTLNCLSFTIHIVNNSTIQHHENRTIFTVIDGAYGFCYIYSMISMLIVFLTRIQYTFKDTMHELPPHFNRKMWTLIIIIALLGTGGSICDVIGTKLAKILLYVIAGIYVAGLFALSSYLLYIFLSKLKRMFQLYKSCDTEENDAEAEEFYRVIVRITVIATIAILSTFVLTVLGSIVDIVSLFVLAGVVSNDLEYLTRTLFIIDSIIGALCMFLTLSPNRSLYEKLCARCERKYITRDEQRSDTVQSNSAITTNTNETSQ
mmetsp:Transcript_46469/g.74487  ORF Transcript_46469/g.74487 Transcript_46469/m.74487 type:complete len:321 (-) Transcript_46469:310-1272(-)